MLLSRGISLLTLGVLSLVAAAQKPYAITGVPVDAGSKVPLRKNINELHAAGGAQWYDTMPHICQKTINL